MHTKDIMKKERERVRMAKLKVYITNDQNQVALPRGMKLFIRQCCQAVLTYEGIECGAEVSVSLVDDYEIHELNREYRDKDRATDVLSFPLGENGEFEVDAESGALLLGDIVISMETAVRQAEEYGHSLQREVGFLTVHSMLHLLGYDHETGAEDEAEMLSRQEKILASMGVTRASSGHAE